MKFNWDIINEIRNARLLLGDLVSMKELAKAYSTTVRHMYRILNYEVWYH